MALTKTAVFDIAEDLLSSLVTRLSAVAPGPAITLPGRQYVHQGEVALDCLAAGTRIWTERGPVPIEDVAEGDYVWAWEAGEAKLRRVEAQIAKGDRDTLEIKTRHRTIHATANHPVLVARPVGPRQSYSGWFRSPRLTWKPEWVRADEIERGDFLVGLRALPENAHEPVHLPDGTVLDEEIGWLLGLLVGDGHVTRHGFACCVYGETRDRLLELVERRWGYEGGINQTSGAWFYAPALRDLFATIGLHYKSAQRRVPDLIWRSPRKVQLAFLEGYAEADAWHGRENFIQYAAASGALIRDVRQLHIAQGHQVSNVQIQNRCRDIVIKGKRVKNALPTHRFSAYPNSAKDFDVLRSRAASIYGEHFRPERVSSVGAVGSEPTFDLTVEGAHNFIADGLVVHNCEQLVVSVMGLEHAMPGEASVPAICAPPRHVQFDVWLIRCVPVQNDDGTPPSENALTDSAEELLTDLWSLSYVLWNYRNDWLPDCRSKLFGPVVPYGPAGAFGGAHASVFVQLL